MVAKVMEPGNELSINYITQLIMIETILNNYYFH